jgi:hypothetical protein
VLGLGKAGEVLDVGFFIMGQKCGAGGLAAVVKRCIAMWSLVLVVRCSVGGLPDRIFYPWGNVVHNIQCSNRTFREVFELWCAWAGRRRSRWEAAE